LAKNKKLWLKISEPLTVKARSVKAEAIVEAVKNGNESKATTGKILLYFSKDSIPYHLQYGQYILIENKLRS